MKIKESISELTHTKRLWVIVILMVMIMGSAGVWFVHSMNTSPNAEVQYENARISRGDIVVGFESDGNISYSKVNLRFGVAGTITEILVAPGNKVKKGDVIAKLADSEYQDKYQLAVANLEDAENQQVTSLLDQELKLKSTELELQKLRDLYQEMEAIPDAYSANEINLKQLELESKELEYSNLKKKYESQANQTLTQNQLSVKMARENLEDTILYAPVSGVILSLANKVGERVGDEQDFAVIHENNTVKMTTNVIEYDIGQIQRGQKVYVTAEALNDNKFTGRVTSIASQPVSDSSGLVSYTVEIEINDAVPELKDGMTCTANFINKEVTNCLIVPYQAVEMVDGQQLVTVRNEKGELVKRDIKAGFTDGRSVEVIEGLSPHETVAYRKK